MIRSVTWSAGDVIDAGYSVAAVRLGSDGAKQYHARHTFGRKRWYRRGEVLRHINGEIRWRCPKCAPLQSVLYAEKATAVPRAPKKRCTVCSGLGAQCRTPMLPCGCPMPAEVRAA